MGEERLSKERSDPSGLVQDGAEGCIRVDACCKRPAADDLGQQVSPASQWCGLVHWLLGESYHDQKHSGQIVLRLTQFRKAVVVLIPTVRGRLP